MRCRCWPGIALVWLLLVAPAAANDLRAELARMDRALHELDYVGTLVYAERGRLEAMRVYHASDDGTERERLLSLTGEPREIVRENGQVTCIGTASEPRSYAAAAAPLPSVSAASFSGELPHYEVIAGSADRIAGRSARQVEVRARDAFRYSYRLWIDEASGLLLKSLRFGADGRTIDQLMFTDVQIGTRPADADLQPSANARPVTAAPVAKPAALSAARWSVRDLPPGFVLTSLSHGTQTAEEHQVYSDGLASVSVYVEPAGAPQAPPSAASRGAISAFSRQHDGFAVYVIGDVPERTAQRIANGVVGRDAATAAGAASR